MFEIEFPIFAFSHCRDVVAAVSRAGGFGVLGALAFSPAQLELELSWIDANVDGKPYGVDTVIPAKYVGRDEGDLNRDTPDLSVGKVGPRQRLGNQIAERLPPVERVLLGPPVRPIVRLIGPAERDATAAALVEQCNLRARRAYIHGKDVRGHQDNSLPPAPRLRPCRRDAALFVATTRGVLPSGGRLGDDFRHLGR